MENKYFTPNYTKALENLGWLKFEDHPVYFRKVRQDRYEICFNVNWYGQDELYDRMVTENKITIDQLSTLLINGFEVVCAKIITTNLNYDKLLMLTADFYLHNGDKSLHEKYKNLYEQLSGKKY